MKTKLLRKVRKRFEIVKYDEIASNSGWFLTEAKEGLGLPFYVFYDNDSLGYNPIANKDYNVVYNYLVKVIVDTYKEKFRHKDSIKTKIWYNVNS